MSPFWQGFFEGLYKANRRFWWVWVVIVMIIVYQLERG
jgi:hypothetical protein